MEFSRPDRYRQTAFAFAFASLALAMAAAVPISLMAGKRMPAFALHLRLKRWLPCRAPRWSIFWRPGR